MLIFFSWLKLLKFHGQITVACCYWIGLWQILIRWWAPVFWHNLKADSHIACRAYAAPMPCRAAEGLECLSHLIYTVRPCLIHSCYAMLWPCRSSQSHSTARPSRDGRAVLWPWEERHGQSMASVNQTRPHCVNQMGKTHSKPLAARHAMCESALRLCVDTEILEELGVSFSRWQNFVKRVAEVIQGRMWVDCTQCGLAEWQKGERK